MTHQLDAEKLAREAGIDDAAQLTPYMLQRLAVFQGLVLEEAARHFDSYVQGTEFFTDTISDELRALAAGVR